MKYESDGVILHVKGRTIEMMDCNWHPLPGNERVVIGSMTFDSSAAAIEFAERVGDPVYLAQQLQDK